MGTSKWEATKYPGVRFRKHPTRKHGIGFDKYFVIRYQHEGKRKEEPIGWASERDPEDGQFWTEKKAALALERLKSAAHHGKKEAPTRISEQREIEKERRAAEKAAQELAEKEGVTLHDYFYNRYYPDAKITKKPQSYNHEETHYRLWIDPICGNKPIKDVSEFDARRIVKKILDKKRTSRTAQYVSATLRQIWNKARREKIVSGDSPTRNVTLPKFDNRRQRFLSHKEADALLAALKEKDETLYRMALLSLHTGMRASEVFKLTWGCIDVERGIITILDAKSGHGRPAFMTKDIKEMFTGMKRGKNDDRVFLQQKGIPFVEMPKMFRDVVEKLELNKDVSDPRQRVCFHSLRHSFASWHAEGGTDIYVLKELLGHGTVALTERYSHLSNGTLQEATRSFDKKITSAKKAGELIQLPKK